MKSIGMDPTASISSIERAALILGSSDEAALITDTGGVIEYVNPAFEKLTGFSRGEALGRKPSILKSGRQSEAFYRHLWTTLRRGEEFRGVLVNRRRDGSLYHEEKSIRPLVDGDGRVRHFLASGHDVSERLATVDRLRHEATHDALTGLPNRALLLDRLQQQLHISARSGEPFVVAVIDVDRFALFNDAWGHAAGDAVLRAVAERLRDSLRQADSVARLGGDQFALLLPCTDDPARVLSTVVGACAAPVAADVGRPLTVTVSVGAAVYPRHGQDAAALLGCADQAMYRAKHEGGNRCHVDEGAHTTPERAPTVLLHAAASDATALLLDEVPVMRRIIRAGDVIFRAGDRFGDVHLLNAGLCKLVSVTAEGREELAALLFKGDWFGFDGLVGARHACTALAADTGELWSMRYEALLRAGARQPVLLEMLHAAMARQLARDREAVLSRHALSADGKVADFLCRWAEGLDHSGLRTDQITLRVTRAEIGGHLGLRLESVSRAMTRLEREDLVRFDGPNRKEVHIPHLSALREFMQACSA